VGDDADQTCETVSQSDGACVRLSPWQMGGSERRGTVVKEGAAQAKEHDRRETNKAR